MRERGGEGRGREGGRLKEKEGGGRRKGAGRGGGERDEREKRY